MRINLFDAQAASQPFINKLERDRLDDETRYRRGQDALDNAFRREAFDYGRQQDATQNEFTRQRLGMERERLDMIAAQTRAATEAALAEASQAEIDRERIEAQTLGAAYRQAVEAGDLQAAGRIAYEITGEPVNMTPDNADEWNARVLTSIDTILGWQSAAPEPYTPQSAAGKEFRDQQMMPGFHPQGKGETEAFRTLDARAKAAGLVSGTPEYADFMARGGKVAEGMRIESTPGGGFTFVQGEGADKPLSPKENMAARSFELAEAGYQRKSQIINSEIDKAMSILQGSGRLAAGVGSVLSFLPETAARDFQARIDTIKANFGFEELQAMRESSPTGGALGQVTERELAFLQAVQGNLDAAQSPARLREILTEIKTRRAEFAAERQRILQGQGVAGEVMPPAGGSRLRYNPRTGMLE